jgi:Na+/H+ antiporter NhaD/arsenite permease-like protein
MDKTLVIFVLTYIVMALGQPPLFRVDRAGAAIIGAGLIIITGSISETKAYMSIDYKTLIILFGMMIVVANLRLSGFFSLVISFIIKYFKEPLVLLKWLIIVSAILSAFFINDTVCLIFTPFILHVTDYMKINPKPYLIALCMASNIGSVATLTGNPQNIIIGNASGISYFKFFIKMLPVAGIGIIILYHILKIFYHKDLVIEKKEIPHIRVRYNKALVRKSLFVSIVLIILFMVGLPMEIVALGAGCFLLITRRIKPEKVYALIDFRLLVLFTGLFILIGSLESSQLSKEMLHYIGNLSTKNLWLLTLMSCILSNMVSNVPAVMLYKPMLTMTGAGELSWLTLAMSSTLAGNLTILGSIANIIVIESASPRVKIGFWEYSRIGIIVTTLSIIAGMVVISLFANT